MSHGDCGPKLSIKNRKLLSLTLTCFSRQVEKPLSLKNTQLCTVCKSKPQKTWAVDAPLSKNLDHRAFLADSDPREVLNQIKKMQPSFGFGTYPAQVSDPYQFGSEPGVFGVSRSVSQHHQGEERKGFFLIAGKERIPRTYITSSS